MLAGLFQLEADLSIRHKIVETSALTGMHRPPHSGYRSYREGKSAQLRFVRRAKDLGVTPEEIRELLALRIGSAG